VLSIAALAPFLTWIAVAQTLDEVRAHEKMLKAEDNLKAMQMKVQAIGAVRGMPVKGAPYSGEEVNETNQVLADGTRIHRETSAMVYRDSEGRTRRETPDNIIINDPVANTTYILNPKTMTGQKLTTMVQFSSFRKAGTAVGGGGAGTISTFEMKMESDGGSPVIALNGEPLDPNKLQALMAHAKTTGDNAVFTSDTMVTTHVMGGAMAGPMMAKKMAGEPMGKRTIEGVDAEGTQTVNTIKAGSIGNDRDIQVTGESWYSPELQMTVMSKHSDPRTGEESFRLININRNEPAAYLFQVPAGYTINGSEKLR
jgi:hypothetical protein